jgi:hypothetical protein
VVAADGSPPEAAASLAGSANDLVLALYGRLGLVDVQVSGDRGLVEQLIGWGPRD